VATKTLPTTDELTQFSIDDELRNIQPPGDNLAGFDEFGFLAEVYRFCEATTVLDLGCGWGRLASAFPADRYFGVDINPAAVSRASALDPDRRFEHVAFEDPLPERDLCFASSVLLHVDDHNVLDLADRMTRSFRKLLIVEIMVRRIREQIGHQVPAYCRDRRDYEQLFKSFEVRFEIRKSYEWYKDQGLELSYVLFTR